MTEKRSLAVMVLIETDNVRLFPENIDVSTVRETARLRYMVIDALPKLKRVILVMGEQEAHIMCKAHEAAMNEMGDGARLFRPPPEYVPPTRE